LSHDPLVPQIHGATPELRARLTGRSRVGLEQQAARQRAVYAAGAAARAGAGPCQPLNSDWDHRFLERLQARDWAALDALTPETVVKEGGSGANEVLAWIAAAAALEAASGPYVFVQNDYRAISGWIAGLAVLSARPAADSASAKPVTMEFL
jgi:2,3-dihydroxyphenylpropionate 1,2-dioxygenase